MASIAVGLGVTLLVGAGYLALRVFTGVIGICSSASEAWTHTYNRLSLIPPIIGILSGLWAHHSYREALRKKRRQ